MRHRGPVQAAAGALLELLEAGRTWSAGIDIDEAWVAQRRDTVLLANHARYVATVPTYRALAADAGLAGSVRVRDLTEQLLVDDGFLRGYDPAWLDTDLLALTDWLDTVCTHSLAGLPIRATRIADWRAELKAAGIAVTFSSGTSGHPALVPRDRATLAALRVAGGVRLPWAELPDRHDALFLVDGSRNTGLTAGAAGLAAHADRVHYLTARPVDPAHRAAGGNHTEGNHAAGQHTAGNHAADAAEHAAALAFVTAAARAGRPLLVFGAPGALLTLLTHAAQAPPPALAPGSLVATGGGWKRTSPPRQAELMQLTHELLGVPADRYVDTYSTAELNTVLTSCAAGRYHVPPALRVEVLDELMQPKPAPAAGRLAFLDPFALSYPGFIATSDQATLHRDGCRCGLRGATLDGPITRPTSAVERGCGAGVEGS